MTAIELDWYAVDLKTGIVLEELLSLAPSGALERHLGSSSTGQADLTVTGAPANWQYVTQPGRSMLLAADRLTQQPLWAAIVLTRQRGSADTVQLGMATAEAYLDRRYTGDYTAAAGTDQAAVMAGVAGSLLVDAPPFVIDAPALGVTGTYSVADSDDRSVLSSLQELMQQAGWPEWTVDPVWTDTTHSAVQLALRVRRQIGIVRSDPETVLDLPGCVTTYAQAESYEAGKGTIDVTAYGTGDGAGRLHSDLYSADDLITAGWPRWSYRYTPAAGGTDPIALNAAAAKTLSQLRTGTSAWTVSAAASAAPRLGRDWNLGDSIRLHVEPGSAPGHPDGVDLVARAYAWQLDAAGDAVTPILVEDD